MVYFTESAFQILNKRAMMALNRSLESHSHVVFKIKGGNLTKTQSNIIFPD